MHFYFCINKIVKKLHRKYNQTKSSTWTYDKFTFFMVHTLIGSLHTFLTGQLLSIATVYKQAVKKSWWRCQLKQLTKRILALWCTRNRSFSYILKTLWLIKLENQLTLRIYVLYTLCRSGVWIGMKVLGADSIIQIPENCDKCFQSSRNSISRHFFLKFSFSEKATKICAIFLMVLIST